MSNRRLGSVIMSVDSMLRNDKTTLAQRLSEGQSAGHRGLASQFEHHIAADLMDIEQYLKGQSAAIESARTAMSQTHDLVERVVEALESVQAAMLDPDEGGEPGNLAVH